MYQHIGTDEHLTLEGPELVDSEFVSDLLSYQKPHHWSDIFAEKKHFFDLTLGSLNGTRFLTDHRLKTSGALTDRLNFKLIYFDQSSLEDTNERLILELDYKLNSWFSLAFYGEPRSKKSEGDVGSALIFHPSADHKIRLYHTWVDFSFNERNEGTDSYVTSPRAFGFSGQSQVEKYQVEYHMRYEPLAERSIPDSNKSYFHRRFYAGVKFFYNALYMEVDGGKKLERNTFTTGPSGGVDEWERNHFDMLFRYSVGSWKYGLAYRYRYWTSNLGSVTHNEFIPLLNYELSKSWELGYDAVLHLAGGPSSLRASEDFNYDVHHRLNTIWKFHFNKGATLRLLFSFDLDEFGSGRTWEGGNGQFLWTW